MRSRTPNPRLSRQRDRAGRVHAWTRYTSQSHHPAGSGGAYLPSRLRAALITSPACAEWNIETGPASWTRSVEPNLVKGVKCDPALTVRGVRLTLGLRVSAALVSMKSTRTPGASAGEPTRAEPGLAETAARRCEQPPFTGIRKPRPTGGVRNSRECGFAAISRVPECVLRGIQPPEPVAWTRPDVDLSGR